MVIPRGDVPITDSIGEERCVFLPAGPKQKTGMVRGKLTSCLSHPSPGEERVKGSQGYYSCESYFLREAESQGKVGSGLLSPEYRGTVIARGWYKAPLHASMPNMTLRLSLSLAWLRVCSCDTDYGYTNVFLSLPGDRFCLL